MKAVIIAGGKGERLGKITKKLPKPLVKIGEKRVLEHQIDLLVKNGIREIWLLIGYKGEMIRRYIGDGSKWSIKINYSQEEKSLGTAGAVKNIAQKLPEDFLVLYGDLMVNFDVKRFISFHQKYGQKSLATIIVHPNDHPWDGDLVEIEDNLVVNIFPKPHPENIWLPNSVNAAVYILSPKIFPFIPLQEKTDFGRDIFPTLLTKRKIIIAYQSREYLKDMGDESRLKTVRQDYKSGIYQNKQYGE